MVLEVLSYEKISYPMVLEVLSYEKISYPLVILWLSYECYHVTGHSPPCFIIAENMIHSCYPMKK